jgi:hypothetical protein
MNEYLRLAKIKELENKLSLCGYDVETDVQSGAYTFDILAHRNRKENNEAKYIMVKTGRYSPKQIVLISAMRDYVEKTIEAEFELVIATPPRKKEIGFTEFESAFVDYIIDVFVGKEVSENENILECLDKLRELSHNTLIESVTDIDIDVLDVRDSEIFVMGVASLNVVLQFDDEIEGKMKFVDSYSCSFEVNVYDVFDYSGPTIEIDEFEINMLEDEE